MCFILIITTSVDLADRLTNAKTSSVLPRSSSESCLVGSLQSDEKRADLASKSPMPHASFVGVCFMRVVLEGKILVVHYFWYVLMGTAVVVVVVAKVFGTTDT